MSILTIIVISVFAVFGNGCAIFPTAISSFVSLYNPTVVMYGWNSLPVMLFLFSPMLTLADVA
mgnify:CR=1 FL=1